MKKLIYRIFLFFISPRIRISFISDNDVHFNMIENRIYFNINNKEDNGFIRHISDIHDFPEIKNFSIQFIIFLHEVGHYFTLTDSSEDIDEEDELQGIDFSDFKISIDLQNLYYNSTDEWEATEWAIEYIKKHYKLCKFVDRLIQNI